MSLFSRRTVLATLGLMALGACGFEPVYGEKSATRALLGQIYVVVGSGRNDYELRERLIERLGSAPEMAPYELTFNSKVTSTGTALSAANVITRFNLDGTTVFQVKKRDTGVVVEKGSVRTFTAYGTTDETYPTRVAEQDANVRLARALGDLIVTRIELTSADWAE